MLMVCSGEKPAAWMNLTGGREFNPKPSLYTRKSFILGRISYCGVVVRAEQAEMN